MAMQTRKVTYNIDHKVCKTANENGPLFFIPLKTSKNIIRISEWYASLEVYTM